MLTPMSRRILSCVLVLTLGGGAITSAAPIIRVFAADRGLQWGKGSAFLPVARDNDTVVLVLTLRGFTYEEWSSPDRFKMAVVHDGIRYPERGRILPQRAVSGDEPPLTEIGSTTGLYQVAFLVPKDATEFTLEYRDRTPVRFKASGRIDPIVPLNYTGDVNR